MLGRKTDLIRGLSRGMQQRVCLARVLVHDPELLLLDEPASGLDPRARIELMEILKELKRIGKTIFISSHILSELATLCDSVTIIDRGLVKYTGPMDELLASTVGNKAEMELVMRGETTGIMTAIESVTGITSVERLEETETPTFKVVFDGAKPDTGPLLQAVIGCGGQIASFGEIQRQLDEAFMDLTEPGVRL
jgi:ABC-2 type transport system ATP-binding protein